MNMPYAAESFWMVLADNSAETRKRHATQELARNEAKRLALLNPGVKFWVLQSLCAVQRTDPVEWWHCDEIPF